MFKYELTAPAYASVSRPAFDSSHPRTHLILLLLLTALIYVGSAWNPSLQDDADASHARAAREIVERGDWVTLHINGVRYMEKAPLMYWAVALSYKIFGLTEFATRLPLAISDSNDCSAAISSGSLATAALVSFSRSSREYAPFCRIMLTWPLSRSRSAIDRSLAVTTTRCA